MKKVIDLIRSKPLASIIILALMLRLVAVFFAQGYGMHDDHFLVIEPSQSWVDGIDSEDWLPKNQQIQNSGHSFIYPGIHFLVFEFLQFTGITDPSIKMYFIRLIHALWSLVIVILGFKIVDKLYNRKAAIQVGVLLASLWFMPFLSVRNLVEVASIPFLMIGSWMIINIDHKKNSLLPYLWAGLILGVAFSFRYQTLIFSGGLWLVLVFYKKWKEALILGFGIVISLILLQGLVDYLLGSKPFHELMNYFSYNMKMKDAYGTKNVLMYVELVPGMLIPPIGLFLFWGFLFKWKKYLILFLPTFLFFVFHSFFPNHQERFILTIVPFIVILGVMGWNEFAEKSKFWLQKPKLLKGCFSFFWSVNILLLVFTTTCYSKRARVESMAYLSKHKAEVNNILVEESNHNTVERLPVFYVGKWIHVFELGKQEQLSPKDSAKIITGSLISSQINRIEYFKNCPKSQIPDFVLFASEWNLAKRIANIKKVFPFMTYETTIQPGFVDRVMLKLNPFNQNNPIVIFRTNANKIIKQ